MYIYICIERGRQGENDNNPIINPVKNLPSTCAQTLPKYGHVPEALDFCVLVFRPSMTMTAVTCSCHTHNIYKT